MLWGCNISLVFFSRNWQTLKNKAKADLEIIAGEHGYFNVVKFFMKAGKKKKISLAVIGAVGVGKSTFINSVRG